MTTIKVRIDMTIEVDSEGWALEYGTGTGAKEVREDVQSYFTNYVQSCPPGDVGIVKLVRS